MISKILAEKAGNPLAVKELEFVSRFWETEDLEIEFSKSFYFGISESQRILDLIGNDWCFYLKYRNKNLERLNSFIDLIKTHIPPESKILDLGCGLGQVGYRLCQPGNIVTGIDCNTKSLRMGRQILKDLGCEMQLIERNAIDANDDTQPFDFIVSCDVIEHIPQQDLFLSNIFKLLKPGGAFFISTDNMLRVKIGVLARRLICLFQLKNPMSWKHAWSDMEGGHAALITPARLCQLSKTTGFINNKVLFCKPYLPAYSNFFTKKFTVMAQKPI